MVVGSEGDLLTACPRRSNPREDYQQATTDENKASHISNAITLPLSERFFKRLLLTVACFYLSIVAGSGLLLKALFGNQMMLRMRMSSNTRLGRSSRLDRSSAHFCVNAFYSDSAIDSPTMEAAEIGAKKLVSLCCEIN
jgi:hypothetical protein